MINRKGIDEISAVFFWLDYYIIKFDDDFKESDCDYDSFERARSVYLSAIKDYPNPGLRERYARKATNMIEEWGSEWNDDEH